MRARASVTLRNTHASVQFACICAIFLFTGFKREPCPELQPLLIASKLFNRKPSEICLGWDSCSDNSSLMLASRPLLPSHSLCAFRCWQTDRQLLFHIWIGGRRALASPLRSCFPLSLYPLPLLNTLSYSYSPLVLAISRFLHVRLIFWFHSSLPTHLRLASPLC